MHKGHLDNNEEQIKDTLGMNDIISVLRNEFSNIYLVDCKSQQIEIYRYKNQAVGVKEILQTKQPYKAAIQKYIEENVVLEDRKKMNAAADFEHVCSQLHKIPQFHSPLSGQKGWGTFILLHEMCQNRRCRYISESHLCLCQ